MSEQAVSRNDPGLTRVAVYIDFDNIVISRYDQLHGRGHFQRDRARGFARDDAAMDDDVAERLQQATVDVGAVIDYASSFGTLVLTRAYADWSVPVNAAYRGQLVSRAVDLVQLFPAAAYAKNGADIRLAVDAVEDMFRLPDLTHVVIVAGDSDYIALAQRCRRLGRYVVGVGVAGSTSKALTAACDEFVTYDALPGITPSEKSVRRSAAQEPSPEPPQEASADSVPVKANGRRRGASAARAAADAAAAAEAAQVAATAAAAEPVEDPGPAAPAKRAGGRRRAPALEPVASAPAVPEAAPEDPQDAAARLLRRALRLGHEKDDADWLHSSAVKSQMKRMDPSFNEKGLGFRSFSDFLKANPGIAEMDESSTARLVRLVRTP